MLVHFQLTAVAVNSGTPAVGLRLKKIVESFEQDIIIIVIAEPF